MDDLNVNAPQTLTSHSSCQQCTVTLVTRVKATLNLKKKACHKVWVQQKKVSQWHLRRYILFYLCKLVTSVTIGHL